MPFHHFLLLLLRYLRMVYFIRERKKQWPQELHQLGDKKHDICDPFKSRSVIHLLRNSLVNGSCSKLWSLILVTEFCIIYTRSLCSTRILCWHGLTYHECCYSKLDMVMHFINSQILAYDCILNFHNVRGKTFYLRELSLTLTTPNFDTNSLNRSIF